MVFKERDARSEASGQTEVDESARGVVLDSTRKTGRVVRVVPFVGRQDDLSQGVRDAGAEQHRLVGEVEGEKCNYLQYVEWHHCKYLSSTELASKQTQFSF